MEPVMHAVGWVALAWADRKWPTWVHVPPPPHVQPFVMLSDKITMFEVWQLDVGPVGAEVNEQTPPVAGLVTATFAGTSATDPQPPVMVPHGEMGETASVTVAHGIRGSDLETEARAAGEGCGR
jgi:hypothetical protein